MILLVETSKVAVAMQKNNSNVVRDSGQNKRPHTQRHKRNWRKQGMPE
jgi:hypothetical protein